MESSSNFKMINVAEKNETLRTARAEGWIDVGPKGYEAIEKKTNPKGDVLVLAEVAGIMAIKKTHDILPLCHPLEVCEAQVKLELVKDSFTVRAESKVVSVGRTGVEMEAMMGVNGALLCVYDLSKIVDPKIELKNVRLIEKIGGKSGHWVNPDSSINLKATPSKRKLEWEQIKIAVVTLSDRASRNEYEDKTGPFIIETLKNWGVREIHYELKSDDKDIIKSTLNGLTDRGFDLVLCNGGTGLGRRDVTPECIAQICDKEVPGFGEYVRRKGSTYTPLSYLSRCNAGLKNKTLLMSLSGSPKAVKESLQVLADLIPTAVLVSRGGNPHE